MSSLKLKLNCKDTSAIMVELENLGLIKISLAHKVKSL